MIIEFEVLNWKKYNPRNDRKNHSWFRFQNSFFYDPVIYSFAPNQKLILLFLFCEASKTGEGRGRLNLEMMATHTGISKKECLKALQIFETNELTSYGCQLPSHGTTTDRQTDRQTDMVMGTPDGEFDFNSVYLEFTGKRVKKSAGVKKLTSQVKTESDFQNLKTAVENYNWLYQETEEKFRPQWPTFVNNWEDYIETPPEKIKYAEAIKKLGPSTIDGDLPW